MANVHFAPDQGARMGLAGAPTSVIPQGVGAPPPPGMDSKRGKLMCIKVRMLDDSVGVFHLGHKAMGQALFDEVCRHLNLLECDYFGLEFLDCYGNHCWLDKEKPILRQITSSQSDARFYFIVKFYPPNPADLEEEYTRYLFALQIKRDLAAGHFVCNENTAALMVSYIVQSECGDWSAEDYPDHTYLTSGRFVPYQTTDFLRKVVDNHMKLVGMAPADSDLALLETARRCDFYGVKFHPAKDIEGTQVNISVLHLGIRVFHQLTCASTFSWAKIRKLSFKRKKFLIKLHPESYQYYKDTIEFLFETRNECKAFWKKCVENHAFFRCCDLERGRIGDQGKVFTKGSSFRYYGRTQKQLIDYVREHFKRREPFTRTIHSMSRSSGGGTARPRPNRGGAAYASIGERSLPTPLLPIARELRENGDIRSSQPMSSASQQQQEDEMEPPVPPGTPQLHRRTMAATSSGSVAATPTSSQGAPSSSPSSSQQQPHAHHHQQQLEGVISFHVPVFHEAAPPVGRVSTMSSSSSCSAGAVASQSKAQPPSCSSASSPVQIPSPPLPLPSSSSNSSSQPLSSGFPQGARVPTGCNSSSCHMDVVSSLSDPRRQDYSTIEEEDAGCGIMSTSLHVPLRGEELDNCSEDSYHLSDHETERIVEPDDNDYNGGIPKRPDDDIDSRVKVQGFPIDLTEMETAMVVVGSSASAAVDNPLYYTRGQTSERETLIVKENVEGSEDVQTYGATGPLPGRVLSRQTAVVTPAGIKHKPVVPPKPKFLLAKGAKVNMQPSEDRCSSFESAEIKMNNLPPPPSGFADDVADETNVEEKGKPPDIQVQCEDRPDIQHRYVHNGEIPYVLHMRHVKPNNESAPTVKPTVQGIKSAPLSFSTFKESSNVKTIPVAIQNEPIRGRTAVRPEELEEDGHFRRKSLDLVRKKRLPSPANFSSQDHSVSPTNPEAGNILEYLERRRRSFSQERKRRLNKRDDDRRKTQPVRFNAISVRGENGDNDGIVENNGGKVAASLSQPELPLGPFGADLESPAEDERDDSLNSLHDDMERLERLVDDRMIDSPPMPPPPPPLSDQPPTPFRTSYDAPFIDDSSTTSSNGGNETLTARGSSRTMPVDTRVRSSYTESGVLYTDF